MKATLICNPYAGKGWTDGSLEPALDILRTAGWTITIEYSNGIGHATELGRAAVNEGKAAILVAGGDGTLNEVIQAVAGTEVSLGHLPYGTVNIWARELKMPLNGMAAARAIVDGRTEQIDLGRAGERYFLLMAGIGFDGEVVRRAHNLQRLKNRFGVLPYVAAGLGTIPRYRGSDIELRYDGVIRRVQALMLVIGNTRLYGGYFRFTPQAIANDGWLDLCIVKGKGPLALLRQGLPLLVVRSIAYCDVEILRVRDLAVRADESLALQLDGELVGSTPVTFSIAPRALKAIIPRDFSSSLIG